MNTWLPIYVGAGREGQSLGMRFQNTILCIPDNERGALVRLLLLSNGKQS